MPKLDDAALPEFSGFTLAQLKDHLGKGEKFNSEDVQTGTRFGDYRVDGGVMSATGYNDYISRIVRRISELMSQPLTRSSKVFANQSQYPYMQANKPQLAALIDSYIRRKIFGVKFEPFVDENWRVLLLEPVAQHIIKIIAGELLKAEESETIHEAEVTYRTLSEVEKIAVRETFSINVSKCIYPKLPYPSRNGLFEKAFMEAAEKDADVLAFCKINEQKHEFARLRYIKEDGLPAFYTPDFLVKIKQAIYLVETKAQEQLSHPNVKRKLKAALSWCERINALPAEKRENVTWEYVLIGESLFYDWHEKNAGMEEILKFARVRSRGEQTQPSLTFQRQP